MAFAGQAIGLSINDARLHRRAVLLAEALKIGCTLYDVSVGATAAGAAPTVILTDSVDQAAFAYTRNRFPRVPIVVIGSDGSQDTAVAAMKAGASDYIWLARCDTEIIARIASHLGCDIVQSRVPVLAVLSAGSTAIDDGDWVGSSVESIRIRDVVARVAKSNSTILIEGETGTGKDVIALALHRQSRRASGPMVPINCAAIPDALIEGEMFGYAKGAFTGAMQAYPGKLRLADGGTLFLDEVGELSLSAQAKLLRAIEAREVCALGSSKAVRLDVRIVAATNRDLALAVEHGRFRSDLYYRLAVVRLALPPLRARREDIAPIAHHLLARICAENRLPLPVLDPDVAPTLARADWPGNARQLRNALEHAVVTARSPGRLSIADLPALEHRRQDPDTIAPREDERGLLLRTLADTAGRKAAAARSLNCSRMTLYRRLERAGIDDHMISALGPPVSHPV